MKVLLNDRASSKVMPLSGDLVDGIELPDPEGHRTF